MTVLDVKNAILAYGFSRDLADTDGLFYTSLNLALTAVNRLRPRTGSAVIVHEPVSAVAEWHDVTRRSGGELLSYRSLARSAVFEVTGTGGVRVTNGTIDGMGAASWSLQTGWTRFTVFGDGEIILEFSGEYPYAVRNVAFYDTPFPNAIALFGGETVEYDLRRVVPDFGRATLPILCDGIPVTPSDPLLRLAHGYVLSVPKDARGTYEVIYERALPRYKDEDSDEEEIPLDGDLVDLLPLLVASYVWLDDEPEKAARYEALYRAATAEIRGVLKISHYIDRKFWT